MYLRNVSTTPGGKQRLQLSFPVNAHHFEAEKNKVRLKCLASISNFYWKSVEMTLLQERPKFASVMKNGEDATSDDGLKIVNGIENAGKYIYDSIKNADCVHFLEKS